jgi:hypothetical protein
MSQENVQLVRSGIKDVEVFWELLDEYVVWDLRGFPTIDMDDVYVGRDAVIEGSRHYWGTWDDYHLEAEELIEAGSSVVAVVNERGRGRGSGAPFEGAGRRYGPSAAAESSAGSSSRTGRPRCEPSASRISRARPGGPAR